MYYKKLILFFKLLGDSCGGKNYKTQYYDEKDNCERLRKIVAEKVKEIAELQAAKRIQDGIVESLKKVHVDVIRLLTETDLNTNTPETSKTSHEVKNISLI